jgi:putative phosphoribosyl transferase
VDSRFRNRREAGQVLAEKLEGYGGVPNVLVLGLPRGGIPVAFEVARAIRAPLEAFLVRKLGVPDCDELAMGAIAAGGIRLINWDTVDALRVSQPELDAVIRKEERELRRRERLYRAKRPPLVVAKRVVVLIDDGLATGSTMRVAIAALRQQRPERVVVGVPIAAASTCQALSALADDLVCAVTPEPFHSVGTWYEDFSQTSDAEVRELLELAALERQKEQSAASMP